MTSAPVFEVSVEGGTTYPMVLPAAELDAIQHQIATTGQPYEGEMLEDLVTFCDGGTFVDVGANIGNHSLFVLHHTASRVLSLEPDGELAAAVEQSAQLGGVAERLTVIAKAAGAAEGRALLSAPDPANLGTQHFVVNEDEGREVEVVTIDSLGLVDVRVIKVDVEGAEVDVLKGARRTLADQHPVVYVECIAAEHFAQVEAVLHELGYGYATTFNATPTHRFDPPGRIDPRAAVLHLAERMYHEYEAHSASRDQAVAANRKYREVTGQVDALKAQVAAAQNQGRDTRDDLQHRLEQTRDELRKVSEARRQLLARVEALAAARDAANEQAHRAHERLDEVSEARQVLLRRTEELAGIRDGLVTRLEQAKAEVGRLQEALESAREKARLLDNEARRLTDLVSEERERHATELADHAQRMALHRQDFQTLRAWVADAQERELAAERAAALVDQEWQRKETVLRGLVGRHEKAMKQKQVVLDGMAARYEKAKTQVEQLTQQKAQLQRRISQLQGESK